MRCVIAHSSTTMQAAVARRRRRRARRASPDGELDADRAVRACRAAPGTGRATSAPASGERAQQLGEHGRSGRARRRAGAAPSGAHPTLSPMPTTTSPGRRPLGQDARQLAAVEQHVVGPLQPRLDAGHRARTASTAATPTGACQVARVVGHVAEQDRGQQVGCRAVRPSAGRAGRARRSGARRPAPCDPGAVGAAPADRRWCCPSRRRTTPTSDRPRRPPDRATQRLPPLAPTAATPERRPWSWTVHATYICSRAAEDPDRQPWRDRGPSHPRRPRAGHPDRGRLLRSRSQRVARAARRRGVRARRQHRGRELPQHRGDPRRDPAQRRRRRAPRLRVLLRERRLRPRHRRHRRHVDRPAARGDRRDGRQGVVAARRPARWRADRARHHRVRPERRRDPRLRRRQRLAGVHQGRVRRRRARA